MKILSACLVIIIFILGCSKKEQMSEIEKKVQQFSPTLLTYDNSVLDKNQKMVVQKLYEAAQVMDEIFLKQVYSKNDQVLQSIKQSSSPDKEYYLQYFDIMFGPFDRLDDNKPFYGTEMKPKGANFYPEDMTKEEFLKWIKDHPEDEKAFTSEFTMIRREGDNLIAIPYSEFFKEELGRAAKLLREAAEYADNPSLKKYLLTRATAFETNDYFESDMAWMDLKDHKIEVVIGPYEVYEDELFNYKASFECYLTIRDADASEKLKVFGQYLDDLERNLPNPEEQKNFERGSESPMVVVQQIYSSGDCKAGIQTIAFNLPNDERVREAKGSKKVLLKNLHEAKFKKQLYPIAQIVLPEDKLKYVTFDGFFNDVLMHEMSHGLGPGNIDIDGRKTDVKKELKETYSTIEECKADVLGMYNNIFMIEKGVFEPEFADEIWYSFLGGIFRSIRFGMGEAHGGSNAIIFNYLLENGAYIFDEEAGKIYIDHDKIYDVVRDLASKLLFIQATGDYQKSKEMIDKYVVETPVIKRIRKKLSDIPIDIKPIYSIEQK